MKGTLALAVFFSLFMVTSAFAYEVEPGEHGVVYNCAFTFDVTLDGDFSDWPEVLWHKVTYDMGWNNSDNNDDGSFEFACVAGVGVDSPYLYVGIKIWDDEKVVDEDVGENVEKDDSVEVYVDGDNSKPSEYEKDVSQITIGRYNIGGDPENPKLNSFKGGNGAGTPASETGTKAAVVDTDYGWAVEAALPFEAWNIEYKDGNVIGFNVQLNDDDDGGGRDHKLSWSAAERASGEAAWKDPSVFGELKLVAVWFGDVTAVSSKGKLATTWASIKK